MNPAQEKIWKYLVEHKTPVTRTKLAKYFIMSESKVGSILGGFVKQGIADMSKKGNTKYYRVKE
jgi:hypothetical protein